MKRILLIATGGTIVSQDKGRGLEPEIGGGELLDFIPEISGKYRIVVQQIFNIESSDIRPDHWYMIVQAIKENYEKYDGFVVVHGTDTLAYTSSALSYMIQNSRKTIVVTGSQYPIDYRVTDAVRNLHDSCIFAAESEMPGVYVVFDGKAMLGNHVKKVRSKAFKAFESMNYPDAAIIREGIVFRYYKPLSTNETVKFSDKLEESIFLLKFYPGIQPEHYKFVEEHFRVVVMEGYGAAGIPVSFMPLFQKWYDKGIIMAVTTQVMYDGSDLEVYTVGKAMVEKFQVLQGFDMTLESVITKLMWIAGMTDDFTEIKEIFYRPIQEDINCFRHTGVKE